MYSGTCVSSHWTLVAVVETHYLGYSLGKRTRLAFYFLVFMFLAFHCVIFPVPEFRAGDFEIVFTRLFIVLSRFLFEQHILNQWPFSKWLWYDCMSSWSEWDYSVMVWIAELCDQTSYVDTSPLDMWCQKENKKRKGEKRGVAIFKVGVTESFISEMIFLSYLRNHNCWTSTVPPPPPPPPPPTRCFVFGIYTVLIELMCLPKKVAGLSGFDKLHCHQFPVNLYYLAHEGLLAQSSLSGDLLTWLSMQT